MGHRQRHYHRPLEIVGGAIALTASALLVIGVVVLVAVMVWFVLGPVAQEVAQSMQAEFYE